MMTPRSRKPVLLISGTNITKIPSAGEEDQMKSVEEESESDSLEPLCKKPKNESDLSLTSTFQDYLCSRSIVTTTPTDHSFSSRTDDYDSTDIKDISESKLSRSLLYCLDGNVPDEEEEGEEKELVLKPNQYDENGEPVVFETSF